MDVLYKIEAEVKMALPKRNVVILDSGEVVFLHFYTFIKGKCCVNLLRE